MCEIIHYFDYCQSRLYILVKIKISYFDEMLYACNNLRINFYEGYSLDRIKMTKWIWPNHDNDEPYFFNLTEIGK